MRPPVPGFLVDPRAAAAAGLVPALPSECNAASGPGPGSAPARLQQFTPDVSDLSCGHECKLEDLQGFALDPGFLAADVVSASSDFADFQGYATD